MKLPTIKLYAAPVVLLLMAGALATPTAAAETARHGYRTVSAEFHYDRKAPAEQIYAKLLRLAERMCTNTPSPLSYRRIQQGCVAEVMRDGVSQIGRTDLAAVYDRRNG